MELPYGGNEAWSGLVAACADEHNHKVYVIAGEESGECRGGTTYHTCSNSTRSDHGDGARCGLSEGRVCANFGVLFFLPR